MSKKPILIRAECPKCGYEWAVSMKEIEHALGHIQPLTCVHCSYDKDDIKVTMSKTLADVPSHDLRKLGVLPNE